MRLRKRSAVTAEEFFGLTSVRLEDFKSKDLKPSKGLGSNPIRVVKFLADFVRFADVAQLVEQLICNQ